MNNNTQSIMIKWITSCLFMVTFTSVTSAQVANVQDALNIALKNETIANSGDKMKLYSVNAIYNRNNKNWSFQFYDGGDNIHNVSVNNTGKTRYYARDKGTIPIFDSINWEKLPTPNDVLVENITKKAKAALHALKFDIIDNGKIYMSYHIQSEPRQKNKAFHSWSITLPLKETGKGKTVGFKNGKIDTILTSMIQGR